MTLDRTRQEGIATPWPQYMTKTKTSTGTDALAVQTKTSTGTDALAVQAIHKRSLSDRQAIAKPSHRHTIANQAKPPTKPTFQSQPYGTTKP